MALIDSFVKPIIIIGMHRSGTSFLSKTLHENGIFMGHKQSENHEAHYFQHRNIALLRANGHTWARPAIPLKTDHIKHSNKEFLKKYIGRSQLRNLYQTWATGTLSAWGWKDPRNTFTLRYWLQFFPDAKVIHIYRNGMDVAISLHKRNKKMSPDNRFYEPNLKDKRAGLDLWATYYRQAESYQNLLGERYLKIRFEAILAQDEPTIRQLEAFVERPLQAYFKKKVDSKRTQRFTKPEHQALLEYAKKSDLMKTLGYL